MTGMTLRGGRGTVNTVLAIGRQYLTRRGHLLATERANMLHVDFFFERLRATIHWTSVVVVRLTVEVADQDWFAIRALLKVTLAVRAFAPPLVEKVAIDLANPNDDRLQVDLRAVLRADLLRAVLLRAVLLRVGLRRVGLRRDGRLGARGAPGSSSLLLLLGSGELWFFLRAFDSVTGADTGHDQIIFKCFLCHF